MAAGASALGFIFASSPRQVTPPQVAAITARLPRTVEKYGVFVDASFDEIVSTVKAAGLTGVQLHFLAEPGLPLRLREHFAGIPARSRLGILQVLHFSSAAELEASLALLTPATGRDHAIDAVLVDSRVGSAVGGTGISFDWAAARSIFLKHAPHLRLLAAGGLRPDNVAEAIRTLAPWGVDVVTGVESAPGKKDAERVRAFVRAARSA